MKPRCECADNGNSFFFVNLTKSHLRKTNLSAGQPANGWHTPSDMSAHELGDKHFYTGRGCEVCAETGLRGRRGLFELLSVSDPIREMITDRAPTVALKQKAIELGMTTLHEDGLRNIYEGVTTIEEVLKYT